MSIPTTIESLSTTAASNGPAGSEQRTLADDGLRQAYAFVKSLKTLATLASASTVTPPSTANAFSVTGVTTINTIASTNSWDGRDIWFVFAGALTLTHSSNLDLPGAANITTVIGDTACFIQTGSGAWICAHYQRGDGSWAAGNITASAFIPNGSTVPTNGLYLKAANNPSLASNSTLRWDVNSTGQHIFAKPTTGYSGATLDTTARSLGAAWASNSFLFGGTATSTTGSFGISYDDTTGATLESVVPGGSWKPMRISATSYAIKLTGVDTLTATTAGNWTTAAPSSGTTFTFNAVSGGNGIAITAAAGGHSSVVVNGPAAQQINLLTFQQAAQTQWIFYTPASSNDFRLFAGADRFAFTADGRFYGTALHNNAGAVTGTTNQYVCSGTYTPVLTKVSNITGTPTVSSFTWTRLGNVVHASGNIASIQPTVGGNTVQYTLTIPITSNFATQLADCSGIVAIPGETIMAQVNADTAADQANVDYIQGNTTSRSNYVMFQYVIL